MIDAALALVAGVLTIASPCVLPTLPILFGTSVGRNDGSRPFFIAFGFTASFSIVALGLGASAALLGLRPQTWRNAATALLTLFGCLMVWPRLFEQLTARFGGGLSRLGGVGGRGGDGRIGGFLVGVSLGAVWTPCAGPVLGSILTLVATAPHLGWAATLLVCYAAGAAIPMLAVAYGGQYATTRARRLVPYTLQLRRGFGVVIILVAAAIYWRCDTSLAVWLSRLYPHAGAGL